VGVGLSDWAGYAVRLGAKFQYFNTFYRSEPHLDICDPPESLHGKCDFVISSDVFEHVPPPVESAFAGAARLLKPGGLLVLTVPFNDTPVLIEHFPRLADYTIVELGGERILVNRERAGAVQVHRELVFHGGEGHTLEMRVFSRASVETLLHQAGFVNITLHAEKPAAFGIFPEHHHGLPFTARRGLVRASDS
jgi:SAM-dependent methyltransferase